MTDIASLKLKIDSTDAKTAQGDLNNLSGASEKTERSFAGLTASTAAAGAVLAGTFAIIKKSVEAANEYQNALNGLASVARYAGEDISSTLAKSTEITSDGLLSTAEAATALKNLLARGFSTDQAVAMIDRFKDSAAFGRQSSLEFGQAVVSATEGIKNENSVLVDNAGVTKNVSVMHKEYAASVKKSVADLTLAEKRQAEYTGVMKETEAQLGNSAIAAQGMDGASARLSKTINDSAVTIGQSFMPAAIAVTDLIGDGFKLAMDIGVRPMLFLFESMGIIVGELAMKVGAAFDFMADPKLWNKGGLAKLDSQFKEYEKIAEEMGIAAAARISGIAGAVATIGADSGKRREDEPKDTTKQDKKDLKDAEKAARDYARALEERNAILADVVPGEKQAQTWAKLIKLNDSLRDSHKLTNEQMTRAYEIMTGDTALKQKEKETEDFNNALKESQRILEDVDLQVRANMEWQKLLDLQKKLGDQFPLTAEQMGIAYKKTMDGVTGTAKQAATEMDEFAKQAGRNMQNSFADFLFDPMKDGFNGMLTNFGVMLQRMAAQAAAANILRSLGTWGATGGGAGTFLGSAASALFGPTPAAGKLDGGEVSTGKSYMVGERGPELFTPSGNGKITPNKASKAISVVNNFVLSSPPDRRTQEQMAAMAGMSVNRAMARSM